MNFRSSFKSFKSHSRKISPNFLDENIEHQPILSNHSRGSSTVAAAVMNGHHPEVIVRIDRGDDLSQKGNVRRESNIEFWKTDCSNFDFQDDPPSKLIKEFLSKQKASGTEMTVDIDLEMDELRPDCVNNVVDDTFKEVSVSFREPNYNANVIDIVFPDEFVKSKHNIEITNDDENQRVFHNRKQSSARNSNADLYNDFGDEGEVLRCTSIKRRASFLGRLKTKSRLMDTPEIYEKRSGVIKSSQLKSGMLEKLGEEDEDDPLFSEDLPNDYKKSKLDVLTIVQWVSLVLIVSFLVFTLAFSKFRRKNLRGLSLWKWEVLVLVLICGRLVSGWAIRIVVFFIEQNFFMRKRVLYFVYGIKKAVQNCIWLGLVLITWHFMLNKKVEAINGFLQYVNKLMVCMLMGTLLWLVKTLMVKVLASSFHVSTFFDRIQESLFNQYVIETLSGPPLIEIHNNQDLQNEIWKFQNIGVTLPPDLKADLPPKAPVKGGSFKFSGQLSQDGDRGITIDQLHKLSHKNISAWNMKRLINVVKHGVLSTLDERALDSSKGDEAATEIKSEYEAIGAARKIFRNVARPEAKFIYVDDLMRFLREEEALKTLNIVEGSTESEKISKKSLKSWVVNAFRERRALALTLNDTKTAVKKLHHMVNALVGIVIFIICLVILEIATSKFLLFLSSQVVVVAFIFGNTCKTIFEDVIFVFVMHPFDVGDRCEIDGIQMIVEEMNILTTVFLRHDNLKIVYPNVTLATKAISNYYRSPDMNDTIDFVIHVATPADKIAQIKERITRYIEERSEHWYPSPSVVLMNLEGLNKVKMSVWIRHRINHQDMGEKWKRRAVLVDEMVKILKELDIEYRLYPIDINIRSMPTPNSNRIPPSWNKPTGN